MGGMTAVATATGVLAPVAQVATAGAQADSAAPALGAMGLAGAGAFESCSAYFGYGKDEAVLGVVDFDVADVNGDDGAAHDVADDTEVLLVLENEEGDVLECVAEELTEEAWDDEWGSDSGVPPFPGPGRFVYPSVNLLPEIDGFGPVVQVGFRVTTIPEGHTLVSPEGIKDLHDPFLDPEEEFFGDLTDPRVFAFVESEVDAAAADAFETALAACRAEEIIDETDADLVAASQALIDLFTDDEPITEVECFEVEALHALGSFYLGLAESVTYVEGIQLSLPEAPAPTAPEAPAAVAAEAAPTFTG